MYKDKKLLLSLIFIFSIIIAKDFYTTTTVEKVYPYHICYANITSTNSHFDTANLTIALNITHNGFCQSA
ncbi:MAG: hypothetical protein ACE5SW_08175 [Nitrososphaeraceae archaeon]